MDPNGYLYVSEPKHNRVVRFGPALPGDVNGSGEVDQADVAGFVLALLGAPNAPKPIEAADMNGDACLDGEDIDAFLQALLAS